MNEFKSFHPIVNFTYFVLVISFAMFLMHPICLLISLISSVVYSITLKGWDAAKFAVSGLAPIIVVSALVNPLFNHGGETVISYLPGGNPFTLEALIYGLATGIVISTVIAWFSCYNKVMTSDRFIYIFGKVIPSLSLIFSMTLRFVSRFKRRFKMVREAHSHIGYGEGFVGRVKNAVKLLSIMLTWSVESSVDTADSMRSRGYGIKGRTSFSNFRFGKRDLVCLSCLLGFGAYVLAAALGGRIEYQYFPRFDTMSGGGYLLSVFCAYTLLCLVPVIIDLTEVCRWKLRYANGPK
ncbi:MAG: energy-coupling factor transporter transmembrane protein EcfT [Clostridia bacterium]|nr:energy-coupling factor transporter transmembrane protein EcfT [Clostridia bacterium]